MDWALLSFPWVWLPPLQMSAKGPGCRLHEIQLRRERVHKSYSNRQSTACIGHCAVCCLLLINFFFFFLFQYSTCASFCLYLVFVCFPSYILFVNTLRYGSSFFPSLWDLAKWVVVQYSIPIKQLKFLLLQYQAGILFGHTFWEITQNFLFVCWYPFWLA